MASVIDIPKYAQDERVQHYQDGLIRIPEAQPRSRGRLASLWASLRTWLWPRREWEAASHTRPFESGIDMLARKHPYIFIKSMCG